MCRNGTSLIARIPPTLVHAKTGCGDGRRGSGDDRLTDDDPSGATTTRSGRLVPNLVRLEARVVLRVVPVLYSFVIEDISA